jgi:hypothetical protein
VFHSWDEKARHQKYQMLALLTLMSFSFLALLGLHFLLCPWVSMSQGP